jgi:hypothetical protein
MIKIMRGKTYQEKLDSAYNRGIKKVIEDIHFILELPEGKLFTKPVTLVGDNQMVSHSLFLGCEIALVIQPDTKGLKLENNVFDSVE